MLTSVEHAWYQLDDGAEAGNDDDDDAVKNENAKRIKPTIIHLNISSAADCRCTDGGT